MRELYSRFQPHRGHIERKILRRHPAGDVPGSRTYPSTVQGSNQVPSQAGSLTPRDQAPAQHSSSAKEPLPSPDIVSHLIHLDGSELFSQLCAETIIAIQGPRPGIYRSPVDVSKGIIRVWRKWLAEQAGMDDGREKCQDGKDCSTAGILWVNDGENVGVRFRVRQRKWRRDNPVLTHMDEDVPVSYEVQYEGVYFSDLSHNRPWISQVLM